MTIEEGKKLASEQAWEEAKGYVESNDMASLEQQVKNETEIMIELADDCCKYKKKLKWLAIGSGVAAVLSGIIFYKLSEQKLYKDLISYAEDGLILDICDKKTGLLYSVKTECLGD